MVYWSYPYHAPYPFYSDAQVSQRQQPEQGQPQRQDRRFSEDLLQSNIGKRVTAYMTYEGSEEWRNRVFTGVLRQVGRDYFVLRDQETGKDVMLLNINLNFIVFDDTPARLTRS
jgi:spore germination protein Q